MENRAMRMPQCRGRDTALDWSTRWHRSAIPWFFLPHDLGLAPRAIECHRSAISFAAALVPKSKLLK